jgi:hypothetical protein
MMQLFDQIMQLPAWARSVSLTILPIENRQTKLV